MCVRVCDCLSVFLIVNKGKVWSGEGCRRMQLLRLFIGRFTSDVISIWIM